MAARSGGKNLHYCRGELKPELAWYIGDNLKEYYYGAKAVGIKSFLLQRSIFVRFVATRSF